MFIIYQVRKESMFILANATRRLELDEMDVVVKEQIISTMVKQLYQDQQTAIICQALTSLRNLLQAGERMKQQNNGEINQALMMIEAHGGSQKIEELQSHPNDEVYNLSLSILELCYEQNNYIVNCNE